MPEATVLPRLIERIGTADRKNAIRYLKEWAMRRGGPPRCRADGRARQRGGPEPTGECPGPWLRTSCQPEIPWLPLHPTSPRSATAPPVEQLDLFALLAPRVASSGAPPLAAGRDAHSPRTAPRWPFADAQPLAVETAEEPRPRPARSQRACSTPTARASGSRARARTRRGSSSRPRWPRPRSRRATTARRSPTHLVTEGAPLRRPARNHLPRGRRPRRAPPGRGGDAGRAAGVLPRRRDRGRERQAELRRSSSTTSSRAAGARSG